MTSSILISQLCSIKINRGVSTSNISMTERQDNIHNEATSAAPGELDWEREKTKVRVRQFMNILEQLPRLCSPTICGTLSQPTTRTEMVSRGADMFEWSLEQRAILSPANITTDTDGTDDWPNAAEINQAWRQKESEVFFSQRTIAPSPIITPSARGLNRPVTINHFQDLMYDEDEEGAEEDDDDEDDGKINDNMENDNQQAQDLSTNHRNLNKNQSSRLLSYEFEDNHCLQDESDTNFDLGDEDEDQTKPNDDDGNNEHQEDQDMDNLFFSPQPLRSSQTQQRMDIFSPETFVRVMEDESTLQSTPKTTGKLQRTRTRTDVLD